MTRHGADIDRRSEWDDLRARYLAPADQRPPSAARGVHHLALLSHDVETTIAFYQGLLEFPLTELFENRDYQGSTHFFFDIGNNNLLAFFDFPGLDLDDYAEVLGGLHHLAISVAPEQWEHLKSKARNRLGSALRNHEWLVALLQRPRRRTTRTHPRPARRNVRHGCSLTDDTSAGAIGGARPPITPGRGRRSARRSVRLRRDVGSFAFARLWLASMCRLRLAN